VVRDVGPLATDRPAQVWFGRLALMRLTLFTSIGPSIPTAFLPNTAKACRYRTIARPLHSVCPARVLKAPIFTCNALDTH
jgi:hypothetical protein